MSWELAVLLLVVAAMLVGIVGIVIPVLPGLFLILASHLVWAIVDGGWEAWTSVALTALLAVGAWVLSYYIPGRRLQAAGIPTWELALAALAGVVGFFVVPVVGLALFFVGAIYVMESVRHQHATRSLPSTWHAIKAVGLSILIELTAGMAAVSQWLLLLLVSRV